MEQAPPKKKKGKRFATNDRAENRTFAKTASTAAFTTHTPIPIRPISNKESHIDFKKTAFRHSMKNIDISHLLPGDQQRLLRDQKALEAIEERRSKHLDVTKRVFQEKSTKDTNRNELRLKHMQDTEKLNAKRMKEDRKLNQSRKQALD